MFVSGLERLGHPQKFPESLLNNEFFIFSLKSLRHRVQVHLEILHSVRRMVFGVSMTKTGKNSLPEIFSFDASKKAKKNRMCPE
jgi:hypothetical protein